jgi:NitT/TauT family transport system permease protein
LEKDSIYVQKITRIKDRHIGRAYFASIAIAISLIAQLAIPKSDILITKSLPWYTGLLIIALIITTVLATYYTFFGGLEKFVFKSYFIGAAFLALGLYNLVTLKFALIKPIFFPAPETIINVLIVDAGFLLKCLLHSALLLAYGLGIGIIAGLATGILIGWYSSWNYWLEPIVKSVGPIPSTAFIPVALSAFATSFQAAVFLIALASWFPITVLTQSGIVNVKKTFFEVADTLGATDFQKIFRVAVPGALPNIFVGIFNGTCGAFLTLMSAEMIGVRYGIGWYINWQREIMSYANVYAGLVVIAISFSLMIAVLFKIRDYVLRWQKGIIKW